MQAYYFSPRIGKWASLSEPSVPLSLMLNVFDRIKSFDDAFLSRFSVALKYKV
jgi:hypothetical protein